MNTAIILVCGIMLGAVALVPLIFPAIVDWWEQRVARRAKEADRG